MIPPEIIAGEAGTCGFMAMLAVAYIYQQNSIMYGRDNNPSDLAILVSQHWERLDNPVPGKVFLFSESDLRQERVQKLVRGRGPPVRFECEGDDLFAF